MKTLAVGNNYVIKITDKNRLFNKNNTNNLLSPVLVHLVYPMGLTTLRLVKYFALNHKFLCGTRVHTKTK